MNSGQRTHFFISICFAFWMVAVTHTFLRAHTYADADLEIPTNNIAAMLHRLLVPLECRMQSLLLIICIII